MLIGDFRLNDEATQGTPCINTATPTYPETKVNIDVRRDYHVGGSAEETTQRDDIK